MLCIGCKREITAHFIQHDESKIWYACGQKDCRWVSCPACRVVYDFTRRQVRVTGSFKPTTFRAFARDEDVPRPRKEGSGRPPGPVV